MPTKSLLKAVSLSLMLLLPVLAFANLESELMAAEYQDKQFVKEEIQAIQRVTAEWGKAINEHNPIKVAALYENPSILYATFKTKVDTPEGLVHYFTNLTSKEDLKVVFNEQNVRAFGPTAVNSGTYTFSYKEKGEMKKVEARYTFMYALSAEGWRIVDHHSSVLPE